VQAPGGEPPTLYDYQDTTNARPTDKDHVIRAVKTHSGPFQPNQLATYEIPAESRVAWEAFSVTPRGRCHHRNRFTQEFRTTSPAPVRVQPWSSHSNCSHIH
jgi:hypothetical protein